MKKILSILALAASVTLGYSQGTVVFNVTSLHYAVSTNASSIPGGTIGQTSTTANSYYYALLTSTYGGAAPTAGLNGWSFSGAYATNDSAAGYTGSIIGGSISVASWAPGATEYVEVIGWSANEGSTWAQILAEAQSGNWAADGFYGVSSVGFVTSGGLVVSGQGVPAAPIFSPNGVSTGWDLNYVTPVPEPTTVALIGLGGLGLAMIRRRK
jgi:hypothetical protein